MEEPKPPRRRLSKAFGSLSSRSSTTSPVSRVPSTSDIAGQVPNNLLSRLARRVSKDSASSPPRSEGSTTPVDTEVVSKHGALKPDVHRLRNRSEYLVLTERHLIKFPSLDSAKLAFGGQLGFPEPPHRTNSGSSNTSKGRDTSPGSYDCRLDVPLERIVTIFHEEGSSPHFGIELWWADPEPSVKWSCARLYFALPQEREDWMAEIRRFSRNVSTDIVREALVPPNIHERICRELSSIEPCSDWAPDIVPVVERKRLSRPDATEQDKKARESSPSYIVFGKHVCLLVRVFAATTTWKPDELVIRTSIFGLTSLIRCRATVRNEERFVLGFRLPFQVENRVELSSRFYREIVTTLARADRNLKPAWPQHLQKMIFDIKGGSIPAYPPPGEDLGSLKRTLEAYCAAFNCDPVRWEVNWKTPEPRYAPELRILPAENPEGYSDLQILAIFRALRFNDFFKSLSFRDVDFSPLWDRKDIPGCLDAIADVDRKGLPLGDSHRAHLINSPILFQEIHAIVFTARSIKSIDLTNVLVSLNPNAVAAKSIEVLRPVLMLLRSHLCRCESIIISGNPLSSYDIGELVVTLHSPNVSLRRLELARCGIDEDALTDIYQSLHRDNSALEVLDTSENLGKISGMVIMEGVLNIPNLRKLNIAGNSLAYYDALLPLENLKYWRLEELNLSGIKLSDNTVQDLGSYLAGPHSDGLMQLTLDNCGLTGQQLGGLFGNMGRGRPIMVSFNGNPLESEGFDDLCKAIALDQGPTSFNMDMIEFTDEDNFIQLLKALTVNSTIEFLSIVGTSPGPLSAEAGDTFYNFFTHNTSIQYLDLSGYSSKLDKGQLGLEFARSLAGLDQNRSIRHLRIRNQQLNMNVAKLAVAIGQNSTLKTLDLRDNSFSLSNLGFLVRNLDKNQTLVLIEPFSQSELQQAVDNCIKRVLLAQQSLSVNQKRSLKAPVALPASDADLPASVQRLVRELRGEWDTQMARLEAILKRNRKLQDDALSSDIQTYGVVVQDFAAPGRHSANFGGLAILPTTTHLEPTLESGESPWPNLGVITDVSSDDMPNSPISSSEAPTPELVVSPAETRVPETVTWTPVEAELKLKLMNLEAQQSLGKEMAADTIEPVVHEQSA